MIQQKDQNSDKQDDKKQQEQQKPQMSKDNAEQLLDAAIQNEKQTQDKLKKPSSSRSVGLIRRIGN